jgi:hypothetical protein
MKTILAFREHLREFYARRSVFVDYAARFAAIFCNLFVILQMTGYRPGVPEILLPLGGAVLFAFLPAGVAILFAAGLIFVEFMAVSAVLAGIMALIFVAMEMILFGFQLQGGMLVLLAPVALYFRIPCALALLIGLTGSLASLIPAGCGIFAYYMLFYVQRNNSLFTAGTDRLELASQILQGILTNPAMLFVMTACLIAIAAVVLIRDLSINYAPLIGIAVGLVLYLLVMMIGDLTMKTPSSLIGTVLSAAVSFGIAWAAWFFLYSADYSRTEYLNYEDDDYYYYVKAVPKVTVSRTDIKVRKITRAHRR